MRIAIVANTAWYLFNFRTNLIRALQKKGYDVIALSPEDEYISKLPCPHYKFVLDKNGINPIFDFFSILSLLRLFKKISPDVVLNFTPKMNIYSSIIAGFLRIPFINNITGLGNSFIKKNLLKRFVLFLYKISQRHAFRVFFQNDEDMSLFIMNSIINKSIAIRIPGSGVDLEKFKPVEKKSKNITFLMVCRLIKEKGIYEYVEAARAVKQSRNDVVFLLGGFFDEKNSSGIKKSEIENWHEKSIIYFLGSTDNIIEFIEMADCVVLPSYYKEGVPKILLEAAAMAKPIITTDSTGCRDVVENGKNGFLCRSCDIADLSEKILKIIDMDGNERKKMGELGRNKMIESYSEEKVITAYLYTIQLLFESVK